MRNELIEIMACPTCLGRLELRDAQYETGQAEILRGKLCCARCGYDFAIEKSVPMFGMAAENSAEMRSEMDGEIKWEFTSEIESHIKWAQTSALAGEIIISNLKRKLGLKEGRLKVLDVGAGVGAFHSWQLSKHGFEVVATELCPEFLSSIDYLTKDVFYDRVIADCTLLPFKDCSFDVVFCKELIHHIENPMRLLSEIWRVLRPNGLIAITEPCTSILLNKDKSLKSDRARGMGISHYRYGYADYVKHFKKVASSIDVDGEIIPLQSPRFPFITGIQKHLSEPFNHVGQSRSASLKKLILKMQFILIGGVVELIGYRRGKYEPEKHDRIVIPIDAGRLELHPQEMTFYRESLIPKLLNVFSEIHESQATSDTHKRMS